MFAGKLPALWGLMRNGIGPATNRDKLITLGRWPRAAPRAVDSMPSMRFSNPSEGRGLRAPVPSATAPKGEASLQRAAGWDGRLFLWGRCGLYAGPAFATTLHAHHALQVCIGFNGRFRLRSGVATPWRAYRGAVNPPS